MAHFQDETLRRPSSFNFAKDVVDYWAEKTPSAHAMHWISQDRKSERQLSFEHFSRRSHCMAVLLRQTLQVNEGEKMLMIMPRTPEW